MDAMPNQISRLQPHHIDNVLFTAEQIQQRVSALVDEMAESCRVEDLVIIGVLRGSFMFMADLVRGLFRHRIHPRIDFMTLESYHGSTHSSGVVRITKDISVDLAGADVVLIDDILDSGRTLENRGAGRVLSCTLLDKPSRRVAPVRADFVGFTVDDVFVVGYGLDFDSHYRELPYITTVTFDPPLGADKP